MPRPDLEDPDLPLAEIFRVWPETASVFFRRRMLCFGCLIVPFHAVTDSCAEYGLEEDAFREELREAARALSPPLRRAAPGGAAR